MVFISPFQFFGKGRDNLVFEAEAQQVVVDQEENVNVIPGW